MRDAYGRHPRSARPRQICPASFSSGATLKRMFQVCADQSGRTVTMSFSHHVAAEEMQRCLGTFRVVLNNTQPGFQVLTDLTGLDSMEPECSPFIAEIMNLCNARKVKAVVRVIPDPQKDIGFNLLSHFHYGPEVELRTYDNLAEAIQSLTE
jgi:hypothetical protein